jgi:hypothetical protein
MTNDNDMRKNSKPLPGQTQLFGGAPVPPPPIAVPVPSVKQLLDARPLKPRRKRGVPGPADVESAARDEALDALEAVRAALVAEAHKIAVQLARQRGRVTSVEVWHAMIAYGYEEQLKGYDPRWLGCVFRAGKGWQRAGWEPTGSHKRPVAIWTLGT